MPYTEANVETAMCLCEAYLDGEGLSEPVKAWLEHKREKVGTAELRHWFIARVPACEAAWEAAEKAGTQQEPYDWEHCPRWLDRYITEHELETVEG